MIRMIAAQFIGNAILLCLGYYWLGLGETRTSALLWSFAVAVITASAICLLHGAGFVWGSQSWLQPPFRRLDPGVTLAQTFRTALRNLLPLLLAAILTTLLYALLASCNTYSAKPAFTIASYLTLHLRKPIKPNTILRIFNTAFWMIRWVVIPVLILPAISAIATRGWRGFALLKSLRRPWRYWLGTPLLLLAALWLPFRIMAWTPFMTNFGLEFASVAVRGLVAYLLFVTGLLGLELTGRSASQSGGVS